MDQDLEWLWTRLEAFLVEKKLKQTKQRQAIVERFISMKGHISAEELHAAIRDDGHNIGLATIYRTLNLLREAGIVDQKQFADGRAVFEILHPDSHHDHIVCVRCKKVVEFENDEIERLQEKVAQQNDFVLIGHTLDLFGYCGACRG